MAIVAVQGKKRKKKKNSLQTVDVSPAKEAELKVAEAKEKKKAPAVFCHPYRDPRPSVPLLIAEHAMGATLP